VRPPCRRREHWWRVAAQAALPAEPLQKQQEVSPRLATRVIHLRATAVRAIAERNSPHTTPPQDHARRPAIPQHSPIKSDHAHRGMPYSYSCTTPFRFYNKQLVEVQTPLNGVL
jgi:hypothetical protein